MLISTTIRIGKQAVELITNENRVILELEKIKHDLTLFEKVQDPRTKRFHNVPKASYYLYEEYDSHYKMVVSINSLRLITDAIRRANVQHKVKIEKIDYKLNRSRLTLKSEYQAREEQEKFIKALIEENDIPSYLLDLQPGYGKSLVGYHSCVRLRQKFGILVKPTFLEKWIEDVKKYTDLEEGSLFVIKGRDSLIKLFDMSREEVKKIDVYVISMRTITNYHYLSFTENYYKVKPENFLSYTGITNVLNDESHKEFEALFKVIMWMNPYKLFGLSATMESNKPGVNDFYNLIYPKLNRLNSMFGLNRYLTLYFVNYKIAHGVNLPHKTFRGYNHIMYEQAIMKNMYVLNDYIDMMIEMLEIYYIDYKSKVDYGFDRPKCLFFFSTVDMCTIVTNKFKSIYKDYKVYRYTGDDDYQEMLESDIIISTPGSTGTGIDIPGLITAIQTVSIGDHQLNIQAAGRLREIKGKDVLYVCLQAENIAKQQQLKMKRLNSLRDRVKVIKYEKYSKYIGLKGAPNNAKANTDKKVFKTPYFGKKNFYKSPYSKGGNKNSFGYNKFRK